MGNKTPLNKQGLFNIINNNQKTNQNKTDKSSDQISEKNINIHSSIVRTSFVNRNQLQNEDQKGSYVSFRGKNLKDNDNDRTIRTSMPLKLKNPN